MHLLTIAGLISFVLAALLFIIGGIKVGVDQNTLINFSVSQKITFFFAGAFILLSILLWGIEIKYY